MDGSKKAGGAFSTQSLFGAGTYQLEFDYTGNQRSFLGGNAMDGDVMEVSLGDWSKKFRTMPDDPFKHVSITFTTNAAGELTFSQLGMSFDHYGIILDNVKLTYISGGSGGPSSISGINGPVAQVPEPTTLALFGAGLAGLGVVTRRRRRK